jgi:hypothetical protein
MTLGSITDLYLTAKVLILLDVSYACRFWPLVECWNAMKHVTEEGTQKAFEDQKRYTFSPIHNANENEATKTIITNLLESMLLSKEEPEEMHELLRRPDIAVTNAKDKETVLPKVKEIDEHVRDVMSRALKRKHDFPLLCPYDDLYERYKSIMPRSIALLDSKSSFCKILITALGLDEADYQLGITKVFFRAGNPALLDALTGSSESKELAPDCLTIPDKFANNLRIWRIKMRWRQHTLAAVACLRLQRLMDDLRLARNASTKLQASARGFILSCQYHKKQWGTRLVQRFYRGHMARKRNGGRLAEIRARRRAKEEAEKNKKTAKEREEIERIKEMARSAVVRRKAEKGDARQRRNGRREKEAMEGQVESPVSVRRSRSCDSIRELAKMKKAFRASLAEERLRRTSTSGTGADGVVSGTRDPAERRPSMRQRSTSLAAAGQQLVAQNQATRVRRTPTSGTGKGSWGLLDLLGITAAPAAAASKGGGGSGSRGAAGGKEKPEARPKMPGETLSGLQSAVKQIEKHFSQADVAGSTLTVDVLGNDQKNKDIAVFVRGQLCTALSRVLLHGFKSYRLIGRYHIWDFVQESHDATEKRIANATPSVAERTLLETVGEVNSHEGMANNPNIKFRSFVSCGLNHRMLHEWIAVLTVDKGTMSKFYEGWAFVNSSPEALPELMDSIKPLSAWSYELSLDYELNRWDLH